MFPGFGFIVGVCGLAAMLAALPPHRGWRGYLRNLAIALTIALGLLALGVLFGMISTPPSSASR